MADSRGYVLSYPLDLEHIIREAEHRWLRPTEICEILRNYQKFELTPDPPVRPPAGSLFLFDRKALRYFRKDGHRWRKKKDGKTVKEAHEKLKAGSVDVLHCYYAHGEDNENFQRRSYWMLDGKLEHIVLVHYREVKEGYRSGFSRLLADPALLVDNLPSTRTPPLSAQVYSPVSAIQKSYASTDNRVDQNGQVLSSEFDDVDSHGGQASPSLIKPRMNFISHTPFHQHSFSGFLNSSRNPPSSWSSSVPNLYHGSGSLPWMLATHSTSNDICNNVYDQKPQVTESSEANGTIQDVGETSPVLNEQNPKNGGADNGESGELKKLDSFGRWMDREIGRDCDDSLMASDSGNYWNTLDAENEAKEVSSLSRQMQLDMDSLGPSLSQEQLFSIRDFSPDWAYPGVETKVLIVGTFLGSKKFVDEIKWGCMFGEIEVTAEVLSNSVIRCQAPSHAPGRVPFYITCSNRLACSEVREFEYRENSTKMSDTVGIKFSPEEEIHFQIQLLELFNVGPEKNWLDCSVANCEKCRIKETIYSIKNECGVLEDNFLASRVDHVDPKDVLIRRLLIDKLFEWLVCKVQEGGRGPSVLDNKGLGAIHLAAALGYEWAMRPLVAAGVSPNFRDARGRTGLHWAAYFGREETVVALIRLGAAPGAVEDPTSACPCGQTAADLASSRGHKGIAGYLAEADLTCHLSTLTMNNVIDNIAATAAAEKAAETSEAISLCIVKGEQLSLKGSLAAVRKSAHAAALIQAAFRERSFRHRHLTHTTNNIPEAALDLVTIGSLNRVQKIRHFEDYLHTSALRIQRKYRGWKERKEFLKIRNRIVKIQAHVRGYQVRKQYKKVVWSVSIVEKAILRWRRKGSGLRGFRVEKAIDFACETGKVDEYEFLHIGRKQKSDDVEKALARVKSMVRYPEARNQYMRLLSRYENLEQQIGAGVNGASQSLDTTLVVKTDE